MVLHVNKRLRIIDRIRDRFRRVIGDIHGSVGLGAKRRASRIAQGHAEAFAALEIHVFVYQDLECLVCLTSRKSKCAAGVLKITLLSGAAIDRFVID